MLLVQQQLMFLAELLVNSGSLVAVVVRHSNLQQGLKVEVLVDLMLAVETHLQIVTNLVKLAITELQTLAVVQVVVMPIPLTREEVMAVLDLS